MLLDYGDGECSYLSFQVCKGIVSLILLSILHSIFLIVNELVFF